MPKRWIEDEQQIEELLDRATVGRLATAHEGEPYVVPVSFVYRDGRIYFHSHVKGRKLDNLAANPRVCFEVDEVRKLYRAPKACDFGLRYASVLAFGTARLVEDPEEKLRILGWLMAKYAGDDDYQPIDPKRVAATVVIEIRVDSLTGKENVDPR